MAAEPPTPAAVVAAATQPDKTVTLINISKAKQKFRISSTHIIIYYLEHIAYLFLKIMSITFNIIKVLQVIIHQT
jgi:hypothetical protein